jgi:hypothetical protein
VNAPWFFKDIPAYYLLRKRREDGYLFFDGVSAPRREFNVISRACSIAIPFDDLRDGQYI